jgi:hypothetical protein
MEMDGDTGLTGQTYEDQCKVGDTNWYWTCRSTAKEQCEFGNPPCMFGKCKDLSESCGSKWALDVNQQTCESLFDGTEDADLKSECTDVFDSGKVCPSEAIHVSMGYTAWMNVMESKSITKNMLRAAALDTVWFYDKLKSMMTVSEGATDATISAAQLLSTTDISKHFKKFRDFSCHRNVPQCEGDDRATDMCSNTCDAVTNAINEWSTKCNTAAQGDPLLQCSGLGYERDCQDTMSASAGEWPGLCIQFQNEPIRRSAVAKARTFGVEVPFALVLASVLYANV